MKKRKTVVLGMLTLSLMSVLVSCAEYGGTIIVKNNSNTEKTVTVYSEFSKNYQFGDQINFKYEDKYGPKTVGPQSTVSFSVDSNSTYGIVWNGEDGYNDYTVIEVFGGKSVDVNI